MRSIRIYECSAQKIDHNEENRDVLEKQKNQNYYLKIATFSLTLFT